MWCVCVCFYRFLICFLIASIFLFVFRVQVLVLISLIVRKRYAIFNAYGFVRIAISTCIILGCVLHMVIATFNHRKQFALLILSLLESLLRI